MDALRRSLLMAWRPEAFDQAEIDRCNLELQELVRQSLTERGQMKQAETRDADEAVLTAPPTTKVLDAARQAIAQSNDDTVRAVEILHARVMADQELRDMLLAPLVRGACLQAIQQAQHKTRRRIWDRPKLVAATNGITIAAARERVIALANSNFAMMNIPLPGGKRISKATRTDLIEAAKVYEDRATNMASKARWMHLIAGRLPDGKTVAQVLNESDLRSLQTEAEAPALAEVANG